MIGASKTLSPSAGVVARSWFRRVGSNVCCAPLESQQHALGRFLVHRHSLLLIRQVPVENFAREPHPFLWVRRGGESWCYAMLCLSMQRFTVSARRTRSVQAWRS